LAARTPYFPSLASQMYTIYKWERDSIAKRTCNDSTKGEQMKISI